MQAMKGIPCRRFVGRGKNVDEKQEGQVDDFDRLQVTNLEK